MLYNTNETGTEPIPLPQNAILVANAHELRCEAVLIYCIINIVTCFLVQLVHLRLSPANNKR